MQNVESICRKQKIMYYNGYVYIKQKYLAQVSWDISYECEKRGGSGAGLSEFKAKIKVNK